MINFSFHKIETELFVNFQARINETEKRKWASVIDTTFNGGNKDQFTTMKVPRQCSLVLLVKVNWREGEAFGSGEGREMKSGARRESEQGLTAFDFDFDINL
jgi:hypothetical protein